MGMSFMCCAVYCSLLQCVAVSYVSLFDIGVRSHQVCDIESLTRCNTLQHTATHYNIFKSRHVCYVDIPHACSVAATRCNTLQHIQVTPCLLHRHSARLQYHCNTLQHTATHCNTLQHTATHCNTLQHTATYLGHAMSATSNSARTLARLQCLAVC